MSILEKPLCTGYLQGCALRKIERSPVLWTYEIQNAQQIITLFLCWGLKIGTRGHGTLLECSLALVNLLFSVNKWEISYCTVLLSYGCNGRGTTEVVQSVPSLSTPYCLLIWYLTNPLANMYFRFLMLQEKQWLWTEWVSENLNASCYGMCVLSTFQATV